MKNICNTIRTFSGSPRARQIVFGLFVLQAVFLVFTVRIGTPPDEKNHISFINFYANNSLSPIFSHQQPTYNLGDKTREVDYGYHYGMSLVTRVLPFSENVEIKIVRLFSVLFALLTMLALYKLFRLLNVSAAAINASLLVVTNLPMVLLLSSAVNNDALVWLGMAVGLLLLVRLWKRVTLLDLLLLANLVVIGGLVKRTMFPVAALLVLFAIPIVIKNAKQLFAQLKKPHWKTVLLIILLVGFLGLFAERVGGNVVRYGKINPSCNQIQGVEACYGFWANVRIRSLATQPAQPPVPPVDFVYRWFGESFFNIVDIQTQGWRHEVKPARLLTPVLVYSLLVSLAYGVWYEVRRIKKDSLARGRLAVLTIAALFVLIQLIVHVGEYRKSHIFSIALNGRYILPSIFPLAILAGFYWSKLLGRFPKSLAILTVCLILFTIAASGLAMMLHNPQLRLG